MDKMQRKRTVLITGGSRGIGKAAVRAFAQNGYNVAFCYKNSEEAAEEVLKELLDNQINALKIQCDVSDMQQVRKMYETLKKHFGFVDTIVNNAGISHYKMFLDETEKDFDEVISQDLKSVFNVCSVFCPDMVRQAFGRVINVSSVWGQDGACMETLYSAAKAAVIGFTKALSKELCISGVTVNAVAPGLIDTDMNARLSKEEKNAFIESIPAGRIGTSEETAAAILFLAQRSSSYISGQVLGVNGGMR